MNGIILALEDFVVCAPFTSELITVEPVLRELVSKTFEGLLAVGAKFYHGTPCLGLPFEVLDEGDESDRGCGRGIGGTECLVGHCERCGGPLRANEHLPPCFSRESNPVRQTRPVGNPESCGNRLDNPNTQVRVLVAVVRVVDAS